MPSRSLTEGHPWVVGLVERAGALAVILASGGADALSGCFVSVDDDIAEMVPRAEEIQSDELYGLRLRT